MAYKARTLHNKPDLPNAYAGLGAPREVAGVALKGRLNIYPGDPPKAMLADDKVDVQTLEGKPWPDSSCDRNAPNQLRRRMWEKQQEGAWPTEREKQLQHFAEQRFKNPEAAMRYMLKQQGLTPDQINVRIARAGASTKGIIDLEPALNPPKRRGRPPKDAAAAAE